MLIKIVLYCTDDDTDVNTAKGVNMSIEFNEYIYIYIYIYIHVLFNEKIIWHKIQSKNL